MRQRKAVESIENQKHLIIASLYANTNLDSEDNNRSEVIKQVEGHFNKAIRIVYDPDYAKKQEAQIDWNNPFWQAAKRGYQKAWSVRPELRPDADKKKPVRELFEMDDEQLQARKRSKQGIDQL